MVTTALNIPGMDNQNRLDLWTVLTGLTGVCQVKVDEARHTVSVAFLSDQISVDAIRHAVVGAGYPVEDIAAGGGTCPGHGDA